MGKNSFSRLKRNSIILGISLALLPSGAVWAENPTNEFELEPVVVTATRPGKKELDVPAKTNTYTAGDLAGTGATTLVEALKYSEGIVYHSQGPAGQSIDVMASKLVLRGQDRGTLILLDGVPLNLGGSVSLENIPLGTIGRVEVVKGAGSVLYGGDTAGGVINISSKKAHEKEVFLSGGNYGQYTAGMGWQEGKLGFSYQNSHIGQVNRYGESFIGPASVYYNLEKSDKDMYSWRYRFNEHLSVSQISARNRYARSTENKRSGLITARNNYNAYHNMLNAHYENGGLTASLYNSYRFIYNQTESLPGLQSTNKDRLSGLRLQHSPRVKKGNLTVGFDVQQEYTASRALKNMPLAAYDRMNYALFAQWETSFAGKWSLTVGAREDWTAGGRDYDGFSPQLHILYKAEENTSFYASAARTFVMPTLAQTYGVGSTQGNSGLRPESGNLYELGLKHDKGIHSWRVSVFNMDIKDYIAANHIPGRPGDLYYTNEDRKNTGLELSYGTKLSGSLGIKLGAVYSNPRYRTSNSQGAWQEQYGRYQFNASLEYEQGKWSASLYGNYLGDRTIADANATEHPAPLFLTGARMTYRPGARHEIYCDLDNLLNKRGITSNTSTTSAFYQLGFNFMIGYRYKFF